MTNSWADSRFGCNCVKNDKVWRKDRGLLTDKTKLPVKQLRLGDTAGGAYGYHTLEKFKCYGTALHQFSGLRFDWVQSSAADLKNCYDIN